MPNSAPDRIRRFVTPFGLGVGALALVQYASTPTARAQFATAAGAQTTGPVAPSSKTASAPTLATGSTPPSQIGETFNAERKVGLAQSSSSSEIGGTVGLPAGKFGAPAEPTIRLSARLPYVKGGASLAIRAESTSMQQGGNAFLGTISGVYWDTQNDLILNALRVSGSVLHDHRIEVTVEQRAKRIYWVRCDFAKPANETPTLVTVDDGKGHVLGADRTITGVGSADAVVFNLGTTPLTVPIFFHIGGNPNVTISACRVAAYQLPPR